MISPEVILINQNIFIEIFQWESNYDVSVRNLRVQSQKCKWYLFNPDLRGVKVGLLDKTDLCEMELPFSIIRLFYRIHLSASGTEVSQF